MPLPPDLFGNLLGDPPLVLPRPAPVAPATRQEFSEILSSAHTLHAAAGQQFVLLEHAIDGGSWSAVAASASGVIVHARSAGEPRRDRGPAARLFTEAERGVLRGGRVVVYDHPDDDGCDILVPFFHGEAFGGAVGLAMHAGEVTRPLAAMLVQTARTIGALVHVAATQAQHEQAVATIGHELRQPLSALVTALDLLQRQSPTVHAASFRTAHRQALHMVRLVETLLEASRVLGGRVRLERRLLDLRPVLTAAADGVQADITAKGQQLTWALPDRPVWCVGDAARLQEVALNLLTNAHRYTPAGGVIHVAAGQVDNVTVTFSVRDTGIGIAEEVRDRVFAPFERPSESPQGLGLGLAISLGIVQGHGGALTFHSNEPDAGSTFRVELPGVLGRTREICAAVQRTRGETRTLVQRAQELRAALSARSRTSQDS